MAKLFKILSIDGGGIRGIIPGMVMADIERRTGKPISQLFDLIAGTSTGGVLTLGVTCPDEKDITKPRYTAEDGVRLYEEQGSRIFSRSPWKRVTSLNGITDERYPTASVQAVLQETFGETRLRQALNDVMITSYEIERRSPWFFRSSRARLDPKTYDFPMWKVARSTSAAPTYFEPNKIDVDQTTDYYSLVDGGVFANNPSMCAYVDAMSQESRPSDVLVVSLGTGVLTRRLPYDEACGWGAAQWVIPIISVLMDGNSETVDYQMRTVLGANAGGKKRYFRFQTRLNEGMDDMDDASRTNIRVLKLLGEQLVSESAEQLDQVCKLLSKD
ncbi:MAG: patatin-like phospholipase family protein [Chloroflexi bacterium]|nr:patatin-like phospholipase family protein [Chloroflexota bacterium]MCC6895035.1 patatin-like phospholipase family protein [Anaerolineae bacterium]